ncbi:MAG: hypothetical protein BRC58_09645 [Cyanobacteria bacterium QS_8_64_29]|nr:MAG: hypothetical protein BRC58_09645 [Cyanobacteria bacterium QS_8_64_29]
MTATAIAPEQLDRLGEGDKQPTLLIPLDGLPSDEAALEQGAALARERNAQIRLLRVVRAQYRGIAAEAVDARPEQVLGSRPRGEHLFEQLERNHECQRLRAARQYLLERQTQLQWQGLSVAIELRYGRPVDSIVRVAQEAAVDAIVMTGREPRGWEALYPRSVSAAAIKRVNCPVVLVGSQASARQRVKNLV